MADKAIEVLLHEKRNFAPPKQFKKLANAKSVSVFTSAHKNPQAFWAQPLRSLEWFKPWKKFCNGIRLGPSGLPGGKINASYNCLDRHIKRLRDLTHLPCFKMSM